MVQGDTEVTSIGEWFMLKKFEKRLTCLSICLLDVLYYGSVSQYSGHRYYLVNESHQYFMSKWKLNATVTSHVFLNVLIFIRDLILDIVLTAKIQTPYGDRPSVGIVLTEMLEMRNVHNTLIDWWCYPKWPWKSCEISHHTTAISLQNGSTSSYFVLLLQYIYIKATGLIMPRSTGQYHGHWFCHSESVVTRQPFTLFIVMFVGCE